MEQKHPYELPLCPKCGVYKRHRKAWRRDGVTPIFHSKCDHCRKSLSVYSSKNRFQIQIKEPTCNKCGFVAEHRCQLDVDHIDGNHKNNNPENLQTLCANCHRLKTYLNKDWEITEEEAEF